MKINLGHILHNQQRLLRFLTTKLSLRNSEVHAFHDYLGLSSRLWLNDSANSDWSFVITLFSSWETESRYFPVLEFKSSMRRTDEYHFRDLRTIQGGSN